jgi:ceramide glucosyltransferase
MFSHILLGIALVGTAASTVFLGLALAGALRRKKLLAERKPYSGDLPLVSVLKPVHGLEPQLDRNFESFFLQDYPPERFELLFCARHEDDPALKLAREIAAKYPEVRTRILTSGEPPWANAKVYSMLKLVEAAQHETVVITDSDIEVAPDYLRRVATPLTEARVGMVTCIYRGVPTGGLWSRMEALGMSVEMTSGVLIADMLEGMKFALGPTMATRKDVIAKIGGIAQLAGFCADDFILGNQAAAAGYEVILSDYVVDHIVLNRNAASSWRHQVRWMKSTRFSRPKGHFGTGLTFAMPFGIIGFIAGALMQNWLLAWALLGWAVLNRMIQSAVIGWAIADDSRALSACWLYPLRDLLGFMLWCASYGSSTIEWRGETYRLEYGGRMEKVAR